MFSNSQRNMLCVNCFRDTPAEARLHCVDIDTAYTQCSKKLERSVMVSCLCTDVTTTQNLIIFFTDLQSTMVLILCEPLLLHFDCDVLIFLLVRLLCFSFVSQMKQTKALAFHFLVLHQESINHWHCWNYPFFDVISSVVCFEHCLVSRH